MLHYFFINNIDIRTGDVWYVIILKVDKYRFRSRLHVWYYPWWNYPDSYIRCYYLFIVFHHLHWHYCDWYSSEIKLSTNQNPFLKENKELKQNTDWEKEERKPIKLKFECHLNVFGLKQPSLVEWDDKSSVKVSKIIIKLIQERITEVKY